MDPVCADTLASFSSDLALSSQVKQKAQNILKSNFSPHMKKKAGEECYLQTEKKVWVACAIYIAVQDTEYPHNQDSQRRHKVTVSQLLEKADVHIMEFFDVMCFIKKNYPLTNNSKQSLISLERKYLIISALFDKFSNMVNEIFCAENDFPPSDEETSHLQSLLIHQKSLCWMLFSVAKAKVLWHRQELLATFHLLLCCMSEVIKATPTFLLIPPFDGVVATAESSFSVLQLLRSHVNTNYDEVKIAYDCWLHVAGELIPNGKLPLLADLRTRYKELYLKNADIDESLLLERNRHLIPQSSESSCTSRNPAINSIKRVLDTVQSLNIILKSAPDGLSPSLRRSFQICSEDPTSFIETLIMNFKDTFTSALVQAHEGGNTQLAHQRYKLAVRYYYLMLDAMLKMEGERLSITDFTALLHNKNFHQSLLACCTEVILMSCGSVGSVNFTPVNQGGSAQAQGVLFPWILKTFDLKAFHFFKVIESFIKAAPSITPQTIKHLNHVEEKILESLAWTSDSPIFKSLVPSDSANNFKPKGNPVKINESMWSTKENCGAQSSPPLTHAVNIFLNKASRLAFRRLESLCSLMQINNEMQSSIWICVEHILYKKSHLLKDRHLDQMIMCSIYAVCKVLEQDVQFKTIIKSYIQLPFATDNVYKQVLTEDSKKEFIVVFYNQIFTYEVKEYLYKQFTKSKETSSLSAAQSPMILSPSYSLPGKKNIFISPFRKSPFKNPNEVNQGLSQSYSFGILNQDSSKLRDINETIKFLQPGVEGHGSPRGKKRLQFTSDCDPDNKGSDQESCDNSAKKHFKGEKPLSNKNSEEED